MRTETDRVRANTSSRINQRIDDEIQNRIQYYASQTESALSARIKDLEKEWSMERWLETNASTLALVGVLLAAFVDVRWLWLSGIVLGFLLLHGIQGWCPPVPIMRRMGVRTRGEIDREKFALKTLRGDLDDVAEHEKAKAFPQRLVQALNT